MQDFRTLDDFDHIEEDVLRQKAENLKSASLIELLRIGQEWRDAGCTPVYIVYQENPTILACVAEETFGRLPS